jgi:hypothetical protein
MVVDKMNGQQDAEGKDEQDKSVLVSRCIVHGLDFIEYSQGGQVGPAGNITSDHKDYAEFADRMSEAQDDACQQGGADVGQQYPPKDRPVGFAQGLGSFFQRGWKAFEAGQQRIDHEGEAIDNGGDDQAGKGEYEPDIQVLIQEFPEGKG